MAIFPLHPRLSKIIISSRDLSCSSDVVTLVSMLSVDSLFFAPHNQRDIAVAVRRKFQCSDSDHVTLVRIFKAYKAAGGTADWCKRHYINHRAMKTVTSTRKQLKGLCKKIGISLVTSKKWEENVRKALVNGQVDNVALIQEDGSYLTLTTRQQVNIHPSSVLFHGKAECVVYDELVLTTAHYMRTCSTLDKQWITQPSQS